jgi:hypothetical protein
MKETSRLSTDPGETSAKAPADRKSLGWRIATLLLPSLVLAQFGLIWVLIAEPRILPRPLIWVGERVLSPWFTQDWRLFAPAPDVYDYQVLARGAYRDGDRLARTPWMSLLDPLVSTVHANRLSRHAVRLEIAHKAALFSTRIAGPLAMVPSGRVSLTERWSGIEQQPGTVVLLERLASVMLADAYPDHQFETVQIMVTGRRVVTVGTVTPDDSGLAFVLDPVPFQQVSR